MPCAESILWGAQSKRVARCMPTCCVLHAVCRAYPMGGAVKACGTLHADVLCAACRVPSMEGQPNITQPSVSLNFEHQTSFMSFRLDALKLKSLLSIL
ncbi:hypothetical protein RRG08_024808 [Elysia crispata]|uniref:Uncharacterized protein n=1 Tax=Elysia crispata TaxID=231223 RepID=A0AAE0YK43_9GAST|nr:hypothetical protein RRG08_024808 [Elysia crispata]